MKRLLLAGAALMVMLPMGAFARGRVIVAPSFGLGLYGGGFGWSAWGPWGPYYGMAPYGSNLRSANLGQVKIDTDFKDAEVFINGNFAGTVRQLKTLTMRSGDYNIEVREAGRQPFQAKIFVVPGKTMKLHPDRVPTTGGSGS